MGIMIKSTNMNERVKEEIENLNIDTEITEKARYFCSFVGWGRSGHTIIAQLLNKHPNIYMKNEFNFWKFNDENIDETIIYNFILKKTMNKKQRHGNPLVIGGKKGGGVARSIYDSFKSFDYFFNNTIKKPIKWIHIQRNPYDTISRTYIQQTEVRKNNVTPEDIIKGYFDRANSVQYIKDNYECLTIKQEHILNDPLKYFEKLCNYLNVDADKTFLNHCQKVLWSNPRKTRYSVDWWTDNRIELVKENINRFDFMKDYSFDN